MGTFFENKGTFLGKWGGKGEKPRAFRTDLGRRACDLGRRARDLGGMARRGDALAGRSGVGSDARRRKRALGRREWAHRGRKGAQEAAVQEIMRIFVAD